MTLDSNLSIQTIHFISLVLKNFILLVKKKIFHSRFTLRAEYVLYTSNWKAVGASIDAEGAVEVSYDAREASNDAGDTVKAKMMLDVQ